MTYVIFGSTQLTRATVSALLASYGVAPSLWIVESPAQARSMRRFCAQSLEGAGGPGEISVCVGNDEAANGLAEGRPIPDSCLVLSVNYTLRIPASLYSGRRGPSVNVHQSLLPLHRGHWPEVWAIEEQTKAGVTIHDLSPRFDCGDIRAQVEVPYSEHDTAASLGLRLDAEALSLVVERFPALVSDILPAVQQSFVHPIRTRSQLEELRLVPFSVIRGWSESRLKRRVYAVHNPPYFSGLRVTMGTGDAMTWDVGEAARPGVRGGRD
jgi:hypothetical protein